MAPRGARSPEHPPLLRKEAVRQQCAAPESDYLPARVRMAPGTLPMLSTSDPKGDGPRNSSNDAVPPPPSSTGYTPRPNAASTSSGGVPCTPTRLVTRSSQIVIVWSSLGHGVFAPFCRSSRRSAGIPKINNGKPIPSGAGVTFVAWRTPVGARRNPVGVCDARHRMPRRGRDHGRAGRGDDEGRLTISALTRNA